MRADMLLDGIGGKIPGQEAYPAVPGRIPRDNQAFSCVPALDKGGRRDTAASVPDSFEFGLGNCSEASRLAREQKSGTRCHLSAPSVGFSATTGMSQASTSGSQALRCPSLRAQMLTVLVHWLFYVSENVHKQCVFQQE